MVSKAVLNTLSLNAPKNWVQKKAQNDAASVAQTGYVDS